MVGIKGSVSIPDGGGTSQLHPIARLPRGANPITSATLEGACPSL